MRGNTGYLANEIYLLNPIVSSKQEPRFKKYKLLWTSLLNVNKSAGNCGFL